MKSSIFKTLLLVFLACSLSNCGREIHSEKENDFSGNTDVGHPSPPIDVVQTENNQGYCKLDNILYALNDCSDLYADAEIDPLVDLLFGLNARYDFFIKQQLHTKHFEESFKQPKLGGCLEKFLCE